MLALPAANVVLRLIRRALARAWRAVAFVLLIVATLASAQAAEPREELAFGSNPGNLRMFSYRPPALPVGAPLIVVLHGCKQRASTFARDAGWLALADRAQVALLLPEQKGLPRYLHDVYVFPWLVTWFGANNQNACFNWFNREDAVRDSGEAMSIRQMIDAMIERYSLDRPRVFIVGLSAGGAMAAVMLAAYPERFAGGAIVAGVPAGCAETLSEALTCMNPGVDRTPAAWRSGVATEASAETRVPVVSIWHGENDVRVASRNRQELVEQWTAIHGMPPKPSHIERNGPATRELYQDQAGIVRVESVAVENLAHAFPIMTGSSCGQIGEFVVSAGICATTEIARFWGLGRLD